MSLFAGNLIREIGEPVESPGVKVWCYSFQTVAS